MIYAEKHGIKLDVSPGNINAERAFALIKRSSEAARIHVSALYPGIEVSNHDWLWAEAFNYSLDCFNISVSRAGSKSPHEAFYRKVAPLRVVQFMKPAYCSVIGTSESQPCSYLGPSLEGRHDGMRVLTLS